MSRSSGRNRRRPPSLRVAGALVTLTRSGLSRFSRTLSRARLVAWAEAVDRTVGWDRLPVPLGIAALVGIRERLRERNLYDTETRATKDRPVPLPEGKRHLTARTAEGTYNDLNHPRMGSAKTRFGRNVPPIGRTYPASLQGTMMQPNPRVISRELLARETFRPATGLNLLAAAWIQFMIRDWFNHGQGDRDMKKAWEVPPVAGDDCWPQSEKPMCIPRTEKDPTRTPEEEGLPPTYINKVTHWWDGSQIYGNSDEEIRHVRSRWHGKLKDPLDRTGRMPSADPTTGKQAVKEPGFWLGLAMMGVLFMREHNAICDRLHEAYPHWSSDRLFDHARLINVALMAKIHTVEWTPAILGHPTLQISLRSNWWGLAGEQIHNLLGRTSESEVVSGIPGSPTNHFGVSYSMTEDFGAVYRMHPLIPDEYTFRSATSGKVLEERDESGEALRKLEKLRLADIAGERTFEFMKQVPKPADLFYSFGIAHPGEITLHNYPNSLRKFRRPPKENERPEDVKLMDLAATDILRVRELGLPRYNEFRELLHLSPIRTFEELTDNPFWAKELRRVYNDDIDLVDLMVGLYAEPRPEGFGFSDTAFRIFILMASRRLNSDRFFTKDYTPEVYTQVGLDWIDQNDMRTVLLRHFPELAPALRNIKSAFFPWWRP
jgi:hypothetical protein